MSALLSALLAELASADERDKRELASQLRPFLTDDPARLLDAGEMAALVKVHPDTLVRWAHAGRIWATKVGREWRFRPDRPDVSPVAGGYPPSPAPATPHRRRSNPMAPASFAAIRGR
jgi:excisionase family DNA binding protein